MSIVLERVTKYYDNYPVVNNVSLDIRDGEFFVLLGPSGSGKTTILSLIAGLTTVNHGRVLLNGKDVTCLPIQKRQVGFVFQNYALFQHMTVSENVEFGLRIRKVPSPECHRKRDELLDLVGLSGLGNRMPSQLSGGQQQRVALARALAHQPDVLLLDEPLGALDAKIRIELRRSLKAIQRRLQVTTILVTHDQEEAFDLADCIGVMSFGRLLETGTPEELYQRPQTEFVASFLGTANLLVGSQIPGGVQVGSVRFPIAKEIRQLKDDKRVQVLFRPEDVSLSSSCAELSCPTLGWAEVEEVEFGGTHERLRLRLPPMSGVRPISPPVVFGSKSILVDAIRPPEQAMRFPLIAGDKVWVGIHRIHALAHPGLSFLIVTDGSPRAQAAIALGGQIARLAHASVMLLGCGLPEAVLHTHMQEARKHLGSGLAWLETIILPDSPVRAITQALDRQSYDLVILGFDCQEDLTVSEEILQNGEHHLLLVPCHQPIPNRALICVASGEPGKDDVLFAGRLGRHLGIDCSLLSVLPSRNQDQEMLRRTEHFLEGGVHSLSLLGVTAQPIIRYGNITEEIRHEVQDGQYSLLVLGAPLAKPNGRILLTGIVEQILNQISDRAILIVRSHYIRSRSFLANGTS